VSDAATRSGFVALAGRPNVGKSTLANALVGAKVAIVSDKPQTTRRAIRGVVTGADWQLVLVDLPGVQRPRDALTQRMQRRVERELSASDGSLLVVSAQQGLGPGERFIARLLASVQIWRVIAVNKIDVASAAQTMATLTAAAELGISDHVFPVSAHTGRGVPQLLEALTSMLSPGPFHFEPRQYTDQSQSVVIAELVREQVLRRTREEIPHAVEVEVTDIERRDDLVRIQAVIVTDTDSQKGILIGAGGRMIKEIGTTARRAIEHQLQSRVHLELTVRTRRHWRADDRLLDRLGIE
jgi:GTP-binding protein Era